MPTPPESFDDFDPRLIETWNLAAANPPLRLDNPPCDDEAAARALREQFYLARRECPHGDPRRDAWYMLEITLEGDGKNVLVFRKRGDSLAILDQIHTNLERRRQQERRQRS